MESVADFVRNTQLVRWDATAANQITWLSANLYDGLAAAARDLSVHANALFTSKGT